MEVSKPRFLSFLNLKVHDQPTGKKNSLKIIMYVFYIYDNYATFD